MQLDLRDIKNFPGKELSFDYSPNLEGLEFGSVLKIDPAARAFGKVYNEAGVLHLSLELDVKVLNVCSRCLKEEENEISLSAEIILSDDENEEDVENPDVYFLDGTIFNIDQLVDDTFVLNVSDYYLCKSDCKGLCPKCGSDLNLAECSCEKEIDPRLAVLGQLLEDE